MPPEKPATASNPPAAPTGAAAVKPGQNTTETGNLADTQKSTDTAATAGTVASNTAAAAQEQPSSELQSVITKTRKEARELESVPVLHVSQTQPVEAVAADRINFDHQANTNLNEEQKGAVTNKFGTQGFGERKRAAGRKR